MSWQLVLTRIFAALVCVLTLLFTPAVGVNNAWANEKEAVTFALLSQSSDILVELEGEATNAAVHVGPDGQHYVEAAPIFAALDNSFVVEDDGKVLHVTRSQDRVTMSLHAETGLIQANGKDLGHLKEFGLIEDGRIVLTPNAVSILTGTRAKYDEETETYRLELDPRLKVATGFDIIVNGVSLIEAQPEPRSVGPVLLLPLRPIAEELGSIVTVEDNGNLVRVKRAQDSAVFILDLTSGLLSLGENPLGLARDITYADRTNLLLPSSAVETLTGTHISVDGDIVDVALDDRLSGSVEAGRTVEEIAADTPFTPETLTFRLGPRQVNTVTADFRYKGANARLRYELEDMPDEFVELEPSWLSLDFAHISGVEGSVGDIYARNRELTGVSSGRLRGLQASRVEETGRWSAVIGAPQRGSRRISEDQSRNQYGGVAAGVRWEDADGWEGGLAIAHDSVTDDQRAVLNAISNRLGTTGKIDWRGEASVGVFNGPARDRTVDVAARVGAQAKISEQIQTDAFITYSGVEFERSDLRRAVQERADEAVRTGETDDFSDVPTTLPDLRREGADVLEYGATLRFTPEGNALFSAPALSVSVGQQRVGVTTNNAENSVRSRVSASAATSFGETGIGASVSGSLFDVSGRGEDSGYRVGGAVYKTFNKFALRADYDYTETDVLGSRELASATLTHEPVSVALPKGARLTVTPSVTARSFDGNFSASGSAIAAFTSGDLFGRKNQVGASFGVLQSANARGDLRTDTFLTVEAARQLRIGDNMALGLAYNTDLDGRHRVGLTLRGRYDFAPKRRLSKTRDNSGILTGQAFLDENRDGIKQDDEPGLANVGVSLENTPFRLRVDGNGAFTIRNLRQGIYNVRILGETLPLGYAQSETAKSRASIVDGRVTDIMIPVVQRGQIRGFAFIDENGNGSYDKGEARPANKVLTLQGSDIAERITTTAFGQYAFDDLPAGEYTVHHEGREVGRIDLSQYDRLLGKLPVALDPVALASVGPQPTDTEHTREAGPPEPAP